MSQPVSNDRSPTWSRRRFLSTSGTAVAGVASRLLVPTGLVAASGALLSACGSDATAPILVPLYSADRVLVAGREQRIPFAIVKPGPEAGGSVALPTDDAELAVRLVGPGGPIETRVAGRIVEHDHVADADPDHQHADLFRYYPLRAELPEVGIYDLTIDFDGAVATMPIQAFDPDAAAIPLPGDPFPLVETPTVERPDGVDRLCTRAELCPFHAESADTIMADGRPLALLVATPLYCSTAYCGPVLDTMIEAATGHPSIGFVHAEVYANIDDVNGNIEDPALRVAPAVDALGLGFEPSLFLVDGNGTLVDRIDNVFDGVEVDAALTALTASA